MRGRPPSWRPAPFLFALARVGDRPFVALRKHPDVVDQLGRLVDAEVISKHADVDRCRPKVVGAGVEDAGRIVDGGDCSDRRIDLLKDLVRRGENREPCGIFPARFGYISLDIGCDVGVREWSLAEPASGWFRLGNAVDTIRTPVLPGFVPGNQVPAPTPAYDLVRLDDASRRGAVMLLIRDALYLTVAAGRCKRLQYAGIDLRFLPVALDG